MADNDDPSTQPTPVTRQNAQSTTVSTLAPAYEQRRIILAQGIQTWDQDIRKECADHNVDTSTVILDEYLKQKLGAGVQSDTNGGITYTSDAQRVNFTLSRVFTRGELKTAMETPSIMVIYAGHSRYGMGPCLNADSNPGEQWGNGGLFRMGFPYLPLPANTILDHKHTVAVMLGSNPQPPMADCHPDIQAQYSKLTQCKIGDLLVPADQQQTLQSLISATGDPDETYWAYPGKDEEGTDVMNVITVAGWKDTATTPNDLGATDMKCRCFCHLGCRSFDHNYPVVRKLLGWTRTGDDRFAYWTKDYTNAYLTPRWVHRWFSYPQDNAFQSWADSLAYAVAKTNQDLADMGKKYRVI